MDNPPEPGGDGNAPAPASAARPDARRALPAVALEPAFPRLTFMRPVFITHAGDGSGRLFVIEQTGRILTFENRSDIEQAQVFLDIKSKVQMRHNEEGLLSLVFHPKFKDNGQFFVYYTVGGPKRNRISRMRVSSDDPARADPASEEILLEVAQPWGNHNGSTLLFGPDGYLYASFGDGGAANDPQENGQNLGTLLATIIRIDVDRRGDGEPHSRNIANGDPDTPPTPYAIPPDNPFINHPGARPEIWAFGLRNVWRMSFDPATGTLWAGDVGQNAWEEIDIITKGGNYGWNIREGRHEFSRGTPPAGAPLIEPVAEYSHREGLSVTGGYVYRGKRFPSLQGVYIYADYATRTIWGLRYENGAVQQSGVLLAGGESRFITSFGEDADGELYACSFDRLDGGKGRLWRVTAR